MINFSKLKSFDWTLFILIFLLVIIGLVLQYSLSLSAQSANFFLKQCIFVAISFLFFWLIFFIDFRFIKATAFLIYLFSILLLGAVLIFGKELRGSKGWLDFGVFNFQVAEFAKLATIIILAKFWQVARSPVKPRHLFFSLILILPLFFLIIKQPDLGSALTIVLIWLGVIFLVDSNKKHLLSLVLIIVLASVFSWFFLLQDYQKDRILIYLNPAKDSLKSGYQVNQSIIAVGSGQFLGRGFGLGPQSQLKFLPDSGTDFVFAVLAEEFGFMGCLLLLGIYLLLLLRLVRIARQVYGNFSLVLICGVVIYLFFQMVINVGMNIGLAPVIGLPLPLVSYGGSSLLVTLVSLGLVQSVLRHQPFAKQLTIGDDEGFLYLFKKNGNVMEEFLINN
ncbi:rod shape-determining protein RodA [Candidatus Parcubacteria bacterium 4484_255]|nr:MAG: rod shape-determining protein RodA [Candidatus Parcubacteria bacterium 4484_255]